MKNLLKSRNTGLIAVLIILLVIARFLTPGMFTSTSLVSMLQNNTIYALLAIAEMMVILTGGIDISIASQLAFVGIPVPLLHAAIRESLESYGYYLQLFSAHSVVH